MKDYYKGQLALIRVLLDSNEGDISRHTVENLRVLIEAFLRKEEADGSN